MTEHEEGGGDLAAHPLTAVRLEKLEALLAAGIDPYPVRFEPTATAADIAARHEDLPPGADTGERVVVAGRLMNVRNLGKLAFGVLQDATGRIQLFLEAATLGDAFAALEHLDAGDWIGAAGQVITTKRGELSVRVEELTLLAKALRPLPEKWHGLQDTEARYRQRYLDLAVNPEAREVALARSRFVRALREAFSSRGFVEVETPMLQVQPGGALAKPFVTHHNALGMDMYLRIAPELYLKRLVVGGLERVFEVNRNFRNEGVSPKYNPEFTMLEAYQAYADYEDVMRLVEEVVAEAVAAVHGTTALTYQGRPLDLEPPWRRLHMLEEVVAATGVDFDYDMPVTVAQKRAAGLGITVDGAWGVGKIVAEVFERHVEPELWEPTFVMDFPIEISPLARAHRDRPGVTERFEVFIAGLEVGNAFSELNDPLEQRARFEEQARARAEGDDEAHVVDEDYLRALEHGLPPTGGLGLGVDRLTMILTDQTTIREVILFPHLRPE